ncbi:unnamed protein product [Adineta steineri]|uniref:Uncharacterized protein n=1 Tax=Adineta steineri TaxID=433720 RepID=A0A819QXT6_9BILA|nr:unnamed protein product [Adineta steineri]CAF4035805.1 unnamed protein product [Adineta steineri]
MKIKHYLLAVNLFPSIPPSTNESDLRNQRISTRLFVIALVSSISILIGYNLLNDVTKVTIVNSPDLAQYSDLYSKYPQALTCPCTNITIKYGKFLEINYTLHQLCSSVFVTNDWIDYLAQNYVLTTQYVAGFLQLGTYMFQAVKTFCESSNKTISDSLSQFYVNEYTSLTVISKQLFQYQSQILMDQFISSTNNTFLSFLQTLRDTTQANTPMSAVQSAYEMILQGTDGIVGKGALDYQCVSTSTPEGTQPLQMYSSDFPIQFSIPGLRLGCFVVEGVLQSSLECFYNQTCLNNLQSYIISPVSINIIPLNSSLPSQFNQTSTIQEIVNELMVDKWNLSKNNVTESSIGKWQKIKNFLRKLNLFPSIPPSTNESDLRNQRISTRLFIIALVLSIIVLITYNALIYVTLIGNINSPDLSQYLDLYSQYPQTLTCPCTNITIKYEKFLEINYTLHQLCSSVFVTNDWIDYLAEADTDDVSAEFDVRLLGKYLFQALKTFCESSNKTIFDGLSQFYLTEYASLNVISKQLFESQSRIIMNQFISSTKNDFLLPLQIIRDMTDANSLYTLHGINYAFYGSSEVSTIISHAQNYDNCSCVSEQCLLQVGIYDYEVLTYVFNVSGLQLGCNAIDGILLSTLECFYNQTCLNNLQSYIISPVSINIIPLNSSLSSQFNQTSTIQEVMNELMVDKWNLSMIYENYYKECQPIKCSYTYVDRNSIIYIITTLIGLIGGLVKVLTFTIPKLVKFIPRVIKKIRKCCRSSRSETENNVTGSSIGKWQKIKNFLRKLNLFPSIPPSTNEYDIRNQRISTVLFIISLIIIMTILITYNALINVTKTITIDKPTLTRYLDLYSTHSEILICPCTTISIGYENFIHIEYTLHQVCNSTFVNNNYIKNIFLQDSNDTTGSPDFLVTYPYILNALALFCQLTDNIVSDSLIEFYSNQYLSATVTSKQLFELQAQSSFQQFIISRINDLLFMMQFIRDTTQANNFFSGIFTNYDFELALYVVPLDITFLQAEPFELSNCSCMISALCTEQAVIYDNDYNNNSQFIVPGLYVGCYIVEALLQSTLECFYNQTCLNILQSYGGFSSSMNAVPLNSSLSSRYNETSTMQELINELMVENWNLSIIYENYYNGCQPTQCSYSYTAKNNAIYIATMIFGLIGGLMTILQCFIPRLVRLIARCIWKRRIVPEISFVPT